MSIWASGAAYEPYVGRWSRLVAREFLAWLAVPPERRWLDVGCGTGALSATILALARPSTVTGIDASEGYVAHAREQIRDGRADFRQADAQGLPFGDDSFDATVSGLVLNFLPEPSRGLAEMARVTRSGGVAAAYVWDYAGEMQLMRRFWDAAAALDPAAVELDEGRRFPICRPEALERLFKGAGLADVEVRAIDARPSSATSTTTGPRSLLGKGPRPATRCRSTRSAARRSGIASGRASPRPTTARSSSSPAPGRRAAAPLSANSDQLLSQDLGPPCCRLVDLR